MPRRRIALVVAIAAALSITFAPGVLAKGGRNATTSSTGGTIQVAPGSQLWLGGTARFNSTWPQNVKNPRVSVTCRDGAGNVIFGETGTWDHAFTLGGGMSLWLMEPQPAHCTAELYEIVWNGNNPQQYTSYATTAFDAAAAAP